MQTISEFIFRQQHATRQLPLPQVGIFLIYQEIYIFTIYQEKATKNREIKTKTDNIIDFNHLL